MFPDLMPDERRELAKAAWWFLDGMPDGSQDALVAEVQEVFYLWRDEQADESGMIAAIPLSGRGLLATEDGPILRKAADMEPWEAGGPFVFNDIDLAFKLWLDNYQPFFALLVNRGIGQVFAIITAYSTSSAGVSSLVRVNGLLVDLLLGSVQFERSRGKASLAKATNQSAVVRGATKEQQIELIKREARKYWESRPRAKVVEVAEHIHQNFLANLKQKTIEQYMKGLKSGLR